MQNEGKETAKAESELNRPVTVSFNISVKNIKEVDVHRLRLEVNYCILQLAKKFAPDDVLVNLIWY